MILVFRQAGEECSSLVKAKLEERHAAFLYLPMDLYHVPRHYINRVDCVLLHLLYLMY